MKHYTYIIITCIFIFTAIIAYIKYGDTILETDAGAKYLDSKYTFDSLFINNSK